MALLPEDCPLHCTQLIPTPEKSKLLGKCIWKNCYYGILADDPRRQVQDISDWNFTDDGQPSETL